VLLFVFLRGVPPPRSDRRNTTGPPTPHTAGRNIVEHSKRSEELCGWAVVYDGSERGSYRFERFCEF